MSHIFISYSKQNIDFARHLRKLLQDQGFSLWMDETQLGASEKWWSSIESNIKSASALVVILSPEARESDWVEREILVAEDRRNRIPIFPVLLSGEQWSRLANIQYEDMRAGLNATLTPGFVRRLEAIVPRGDSAVTPPPLPGPVLHAAPPTKSGFLAHSNWQGIGAIVGVLALFVTVVLYLVSNNSPSATAPTPTSSPTLTRTPSPTDTPTPPQLSGGTATQAIDSGATATEAILQRTVIAQEATNAALMTENAHFVQTITATLTPVPRSTSGLEVGGQARVRLAAGYNIFDIRSEADQQSLKRVELPDGAVVTILDGPVAADGYLWWKVRTQDGIEGWGQEALGGSNQALLPITQTATPIVTPFMLTATPIVTRIVATDTPIVTRIVPTATSIGRGYPCEGTIASSFDATIVNVVHANPSFSSALRNPVEVGTKVMVRAKSGTTLSNIWYEITGQDRRILGWIPALYIGLSEACPVP